MNEREGWTRVGTLGDLRDRLGLPDAAAAWDAIACRSDIEVDRADGEGKPWVVWIRVAATS